MANAKRASMREGPLAALFRKTEAGEDQPGEDAPKEQGSDSAQGDTAATERASSAAGRARPHPGLSTPPAADEHDAPARVPTPRERLRHAFSLEIPQDIMDRRRDEVLGYIRS